MRKQLGTVLKAFGIMLTMILPAQSQYYQDSYPQYNYENAHARGRRQIQQYGDQTGSWNHPAMVNDPRIHYEDRDAEAILREQLTRQGHQYHQYGQDQYSQQNMYDNPHAPRVYDEDQVRQVMTEGRRVTSVIKNRNGKPYIVIDKRNFQFYLCDGQGSLLRIGPVAIGKGKTDVGSFETPVGIFPIKAKIPVDDWIRPDWYFVEEGEPIPKRWEDRRVPGFFRYKLVFDGTRYIHYAEATGGRLTHGCLGLDWHDAEAVFHTMEVGSFCIIIDQPFLTRLARGEFPIQREKPEVKQAKNESQPPSSNQKSDTEGISPSRPAATNRSMDNRVFGSLW